MTLDWFSGYKLDSGDRGTAIIEQFSDVAYLLTPVGVLMDTFFVIFFRWILTKAAGLTRFWAIKLYFIATILVAALLIGPAVVLIVPSLYPHFFPLAIVLGPEMTTLNHLLVCLLSSTNVVDALCLLLLLLIMALLMTHRLLWPLIKRPVYAANRKQLVKNTKLLGALGTMLLLYAFPNNPVVKWLTQFLPNLKG